MAVRLHSLVVLAAPPSVAAPARFQELADLEAGLLRSSWMELDSAARLPRCGLDALVSSSGPPRGNDLAHGCWASPPLLVVPLHTNEHAKLVFDEMSERGNLTKMQKR
jgi:hypothetical protein